MASKKQVRTYALTPEAIDILDFQGYYDNQRKQGEFISQLIVDYHAAVQLERGRRERTLGEIAGELSKLADLLEAAGNRSNAGVAAKLVRLAIDLLSE